VCSRSLALSPVRMAMAGLSARLPASVQQSLAILNPLFTIALESALGCQIRHPALYVSVITLTVGAFFISNSEYSAPAPFANGFMYGPGTMLEMIAVLSSACKYVFLRTLLIHNKRQLGAVSFIFWVDMLSFIGLSMIAVANGEFVAMAASLADSSAGLSVHVFLSACLGGLRFFTEIYALRFVTALDLSAVNSFAHIATIALPPSMRDGGRSEHTDTIMSPSTFTIGLVLVVFSLAAYWTLLRCLPPEQLTFYRCYGNHEHSCLGSADQVVLGGAAPHYVESDIAARPRAQPDLHVGFFFLTRPLAQPDEDSATRRRFKERAYSAQASTIAYAERGAV